MAALTKRLKDAENKLTVPDDREEKYINELIEWQTTGDATVLVTPQPPGKPTIAYYHIVKERMKKQGLEIHSSIREEIDRGLREPALNSDRRLAENNCQIGGV